MSTYDIRVLVFFIWGGGGGGALLKIRLEMCQCDTHAPTKGHCMRESLCMGCMYETYGQG